MAAQPLGVFYTPYGVTVPVYDDPNDKEGYLFDLNSTAICCGIFDECQRQQFVEKAKAGGILNAEDVQCHGGFMPLLRVPLSKPTDAVYPTILASPAQELGIGVPVENIVTAVMDRHRWFDRAATLLHIVEQNFSRVEKRDTLGCMALTLALQMIATGALEHLAETEIDCLEAAAFYALTTHTAWKNAGISWLEPVRNTWFRQWVNARPVYKTFAARCREDTDLPAWIAGAQP